MAYKNKEDQKKYFKEWYQRNKVPFNKQVAKLNKIRKREFFERIAKVKAESGCIKCGEAHPACLQFHHVKGDKRYCVSSMAGLSWKRIQTEMDKCVVVCANCHFKIHYKQEEGSNPSGLTFITGH